MARHAAKNYGVSVLGVTLSGEQAKWAQERITAEGLDDLVEVRHLDYRDADRYTVALGEELLRRGVLK